MALLHYKCKCNSIITYIVSCIKLIKVLYISITSGVHVHLCILMCTYKSMYVRNM